MKHLNERIPFGSSGDSRVTILIRQQQLAWQEAAADAWLSARAHTWEKAEHEQARYSRLETEIARKRQLLPPLNERRV